jgi:hypothetical protein
MVVIFDIAEIFGVPSRGRSAQAALLEHEATRIGGFSYLLMQKFGDLLHVPIKRWGLPYSDLVMLNFSRRNSTLKALGSLN